MGTTDIYIHREEMGKIQTKIFETNYCTSIRHCEEKCSWL